MYGVALYTVVMEFDPTLQLENDTPEYGVPGKMLSDREKVWGGPLQNIPQNSFSTLDTSLENGTLKSDRNIFNEPYETKKDVNVFSKLDPRISFEEDFNKEPNEIVILDQGSTSKNLPDFYEPIPYEDRALVNPRDLAKKLLAKVEYKEEFGADMLEFFLSKSRTRIAREIHYSKTGEMFEKEKDIPNAPPMFSEFGRTIGVSDRTLKGWVKKYPAFQEAYEICTDIIQEFFVENGVKGNYASQFSIFAAKNLTKMKDVMVNKNENYDMKSILDAIEKGMSPNGD